MASFVEIVAPQVLCIYSSDSRERSFKFLQELDYLLRNSTSRIVIDLSAVVLATASASVILFAFVNRAQLLSDAPSFISFKFPKKESNGHRWIVKTGLSKALMANTKEKILELQEEGRYFQSGDSAFDAAVSMHQLLNSNASLPLSPELKEYMGTAINEAVLNVTHHAYEHLDGQMLKDQIGGARWWQCAWSVNEENPQKIVFIIYDVGQGINKSYTQGSTHVKGIADKERKILAEAMTFGNTRLRHLTGRGRGSEDIKYPAQAGLAVSSELLVISSSCAYSVSSSEPEKYSTAWLEREIPGTLLEWTFSVEVEN